MVQRFIAEDTSPAAKERVLSFLRNDEFLYIRDHPEMRTDGSGIWSASNNRSYGRLSHGFIFVQDWLGIYNQLDRRSKQLLALKGYQLLTKWRDTKHAMNSMAYHDETTAQRVIFISGFITKFYDHLTEPAKQEIIMQVSEDTQRLQTEEFYSGTNNHGMFQDIAVLVAAELILDVNEALTAQDLAFDRLGHYFASCFTSEGVHIENSPSYHLMVSEYLRKLIDYAGKRGNSDFKRHFAPILTNADLYAAYALAPNKKFAPISDTASIAITRSRSRRAFPDGYLEGVATQGSSGVLPSAPAYVLPSSGYAIHRTDFRDPNSSYVFFSAAYNDDYHKHSDDLSIYLANNGQEILREAGPYGYDQRDPFTAYGFHSRAHNTLLVNDAGLPRTDKKASKLTLTDLNSSESSLDVEGQSQRFAGVSWSRRVIVNERGADDPIYIHDRVSSQREKKFTIMWHFSPALTLKVGGNSVEAFDDEGLKVAELTWSGTASERVEVVSEQLTPHLQGWWFPSMGRKEPAPVVEVDFRDTTVDVSWEVRMEDFLIPDHDARPFKLEPQTFHGEKPVHFQLDLPDKQQPKGLIVVFTATLPTKWESASSYRSTLENAAYAKLYIQDSFGDQGAYYLSSHRNFAEFRSVQGLIATIISKLNITREQCIAIGSAKGGTGALLHGATSGIARVTVAAPQFHLGSYLESSHPNILTYIAGGSTDADKHWANSIVSSVLQSAPKISEITILVGKSDHHYKNHVSPLGATLRKLGYDAKILTLPGTPHDQMGVAFDNFLQGFSAGFEQGKEILHTVSLDSVHAQFGLAVSTPKNSRVQAVLFKNGKAITKSTQLKNNTTEWSLSERGVYRARVYVDLPGSSERIAFGTRSLRFT